MMPYYVVTEDGRFRDIAEIDSDNLFDYMQKDRPVSTTAGSVEEYEKFFDLYQKLYPSLKDAFHELAHID